MRLIVFVILQLNFGIRSQSLEKNESDGDFFRFALDRVTKTSANLIDTDKCGVQLVDEAVEHFGNTYMFIEDDNLHEKLLQNLQLNFVHSYFTEPGFLTYMNFESFYHLLIFGKKFELREVIKRRKPFQSTKFFFFVENYQQVIEKFEILWEHRLVDAVASYVEEADIYYYTYFPYWPTHCSRVGTPHLLAKCNILTGVFSHKEKLFPSKVKDLHNCPINVTFAESVPSSYYSKSNKLVGWEVELLSELLERINGVPNYKLLRSKKSVYSRQNGYLRLVKNSEMGGGSAMSLSSLLVTDFCMYGMSVCAIWIVPKENIGYKFDFFAKIFTTPVWILLLITYFVMAFVMSLLFKVNLSNVLFKLLPFLLGTTTRVKKTSKLFGALWLWFCVIMNAVYQSGYQSRLLVPQTSRTSINTSQIMNSNLKIFGIPEMLIDILPYFKKRFNVSERRFKIRKRLSYESWVYRMTVKKDSAFFGLREPFHFYIEKTELAGKVEISDTCLVKYLLTLVLKRNSHLTVKITKLANRFNENGFLDFLIRKHISRESRRNIPQSLMEFLKPIEGSNGNEMPPPINMKKISAIFICLAAGASLGLLAFLMEFTFKWGLNKIKEKQ